MTCTITSVDANLPKTWCGFTWLKSTTAKTLPTHRYSGESANVCPTGYTKQQLTSGGTRWLATHVWGAGAVGTGLGMRRDYNITGTPPFSGNAHNVLRVMNLTDSRFWQYATWWPGWYTFVFTTQIGKISGVARPTYNAYNLTGAFFGSTTSGGVTYAWAQGGGW